MGKELSELQKDLFKLQDKTYKAFHSSLLPTVEKTAIIGVRVPLLRKYAKTLKKSENATLFLSSLPHRYNEENLLHALLLSEIKEPKVLLSELNRFLPFVNNWQVCDIINPKAFKKNTDLLAESLPAWLNAEKPYEIRFGIKMLMDFFLAENFEEKYLKTVSEIRSDDYYVKMMIAWYFATALAKQYEKALPYLEKRRLPLWEHNKTIQKSVESFRIPEERKIYLKTLRIKNKAEK